MRKTELVFSVHAAKPTVSALSECLAINVPLPGEPPFNVLTLFIDDMAIARSLGEALMRESYLLEQIAKLKAAVIPSLADDDKRPEWRPDAVG